MEWHLHLIDDEQREVEKGVKVLRGCLFWEQKCEQHLRRKERCCSLRSHLQTPIGKACPSQLYLDSPKQAIHAISKCQPNNIIISHNLLLCYLKLLDYDDSFLREKVFILSTNGLLYLICVKSNFINLYVYINICTILCTI